MATVSVATTVAPDTTSEKVENATSTRASPTGQRRRSHSPAQPSAPATTSAVNSQDGGSVDDSRRPPITSNPKITANRNSNVSTTQSRGRRRGAAADAVPEAFILAAYRPEEPDPRPAARIDTEVTAAATSVGRGGPDGRSAYDQPSEARIASSRPAAGCAWR